MSCCMVLLQVANYLVRDLAQNTMTAELLQPDELVSGLIAQVLTSCTSLAHFARMCRASANRPECGAVVL